MNQPALSAKGIEFSYGRSTVIEDVSLTVSPGELVGLLGPNGAGKSTLLRILLGFLKPTKGVVEVDGTLMGSLSRREIARRIAFVPQENPADFEFLVREIVQMGRTPYLGRFQPMKKADRKAIRHAMQAADISDMADRPVAQLSGGERQRVVLARAFAQETSTLLLDEPSANLDLLHAHQTMTLLRERLRDGVAAIAALHDLNLTLQYCDRVVLLHQGRVAAEGPPHEVLSPAQIEAVYGVRTTRHLIDDAHPVIRVDGIVERELI